MKRFTFLGCSLTAGEGLDNEKTDNNNYTNIIANYYGAQVKNLAKSGNSNYNIFIEALNEILYNEQDLVFVQWSSPNRHWLYPNLDCNLIITANSKQKDIKYLDTMYSAKFLQSFADQFLLLNHDYHNLIQVGNFSKILETVSTNKTQLIFINGLLPWTKEIKCKQSLSNPAKYFSEYTKELLSLDLLPDQDIAKFFTTLYDTVKKLDSSLWVNMFSSMQNEMIDLGTDNSHPGIGSHKHYASMIIEYLNNDKKLQH